MPFAGMLEDGWHTLCSPMAFTDDAVKRKEPINICVSLNDLCAV